MLRRCIVFCAVLPFLLVSVAHGNVPTIVLKQQKSVVTILINDKKGNQVASGSGFIIDSSGLVATNYHVLSQLLEGDNTILVKTENGGFYLTDSLYSYDGENDLAILRITGKDLPAVKLASGYKPKQGESITVIGSPLGLETTITDGIVSSIRGNDGLIQMTAPISPGSSGSPVFNSKGAVIGIATFIIQGGQSLNFAIPIKYLLALKEGKKEPKKVSKELPPQDDLSACPTIGPTSEIVSAKAEIKQCPKSSAAYRRLGNAYADMRLYEEAVKTFEQAVTLKPDDSITYFNLGSVYAMLMRDQDALQAFRKAVKFNPSDATAFWSLGQTYAKLKMHKEAIAALEEARRLNPSFPPVYDRLGYVYNAIGLYQEALEAFREAVRLSPADSTLRTNLGDAYSNVGQIDKAMQEYKEAVRLAPDDIWALYDIGLFYNAQGQCKEAIEVFQRIIKLRPDNAKAYSAMGVSYMFLEMNRSAIDAFKTSLKLNPNDDTLRSMLGVLYAQIKDKDAAMEEYNILKKRHSPLADQVLKSIENSAVAE